MCTLWTFLRILAVQPLLLLLATGQLDSHEWRWFKPSITAQVREIQQKEAADLLSEFCQSEVESIKAELHCSVRSLGSAFSDIVDATFQPQGVILGHFLGPQSDDAVISGWSRETHPERWGGTLLLTRRGGKWVPLWYKSALITHSCQKVLLPDGREILLCEDEDGGMGHQFHYLYSVDLERPAELKDSLLAEAESFSDGCQVQRQEMEPTRWTQSNKSLFVVVRTSEFQRVSTEPTCYGFPNRKQPPAVLTMQFAVTEEGLRKIAGR